jgi:hypothetical protein
LAQGSSVEIFGRTPPSFNGLSGGGGGGGVKQTCGGAIGGGGGLTVEPAVARGRAERG